MPETLSISEAVKRTIQRFVLALHTAMPGVVVSYDAPKQQADVRPLLKWQRFLPGSAREVFDLPVLPDVLVCYPRGAGKGIHYPLSAGDLVLLIFCSRSLVGWRSASDATMPADPGRALTPTPLDAAVALPLMTHDADALSILSGGSTINIGSDSGSPDFVALEDPVNSALNEIASALDALAAAAPGSSDGGTQLQTALKAAWGAGTPPKNYNTGAQDVKAT